jgi:cell division protein FtsI (penicillin-binding protein 3)
MKSFQDPFHAEKLKKSSGYNRFLIVLGILIFIFIGILVRLGYLASYDRSFLTTHAEQQTTRIQILAARRGTIYDRNGVPLAVSTPMTNIIFDPKQMLLYPKFWTKLINMPGLNLSYDQIQTLIHQNATSQFIYVAKALPPAQGEAIKNLKVPGVYIENAPETFYPLGPAAAQIIGFTDVNNKGQDGLEFLLEPKLKAIDGKALVSNNGIGQTLAVEKIIKPAIPGQDVYVSLDSHIQEAAYNALKDQVISTQAESGSAVVLNPRTGELLAVATYPSFNPNDFNARNGHEVRAQPFTDAFEPGSTAKLVTISAALDSKKYTPDTQIETSPGYYFLKGHHIKDDGDYGVLSVTSVITKSSNVGASKIALSLPHDQVYQRFIDLGIGQNPGGGFPSSTSGIFHSLNKIGDFVYATMSFGYGFTASLVQMARMYGAVADHGIVRQVTLLKTDGPMPGKQVITKETADQMIPIFQTVTAPDSTGLLANIPGYDVAGKTGTAHIAENGHYTNQYNAEFIGMVPVPNPVVVVAVQIYKPKGHFNAYGGVSAAPVFAKIASACMRELGVPPTERVIDLDLFKNQQRFIQAIVRA